MAPIRHTAPAIAGIPVLLRYTFYRLRRTDGHGGDSGSVPTSSTGLRPKPKILKYCAKVRKACYDYCGIFEWFVLGCCKGEDGRGLARKMEGGDDERAFESCEEGVEKVILKAFRECWRLEVRVCLSLGCLPQQ